MAELWVGVEESYWNHLNAAPVGSITFKEETEDKVGRRGGRERRGVRVVNEKQHIYTSVCKYTPQIYNFTGNLSFLHTLKRGMFF